MAAAAIVLNISLKIGTQHMLLLSFVQFGYINSASQHMWFDQTYSSAESLPVTSS